MLVDHRLHRDMDRGQSGVEIEMDKMTLDALNRGWAMGFGTVVRARKTDFDLLRAEKEERMQRKARGRPIPRLFGR
jgi:hypothetical protein